MIRLAAKFLVLIPFLIYSQIIKAQSGSLVKNTFSTSPVGLVYFETNEPNLPTSPIQICSTGTVTVTRSSASVLALASGASANAPQAVRFNPITRQLTAAVNLTITGGSGAGSVDIYGILMDDKTMELRAINRTSNTLTCGSGCTIIPATNTVSVQSIMSKGVFLYTWSTSNGQWANAGTNIQTATDCWVDSITLTNLTGADVTVTGTDGLTNAFTVLPESKIAANQMVVVNFPGAKFFEKGLLLNSGTAGALDVSVRGGRK